MSNKPPIEVPQGAIRLNTDSQKLEFFAQDRWYEMATNVPTLDGGTRGLRAGGQVVPANARTDTIDFITIPTAGNATDFGNLTQVKFAPASAASRSRAVFMCGGTPTRLSEIDFVTVSSTGNATNFGSMTAARSAGGQSGFCNQTRAICVGGSPDTGANTTDVIDFITISQTGSGVDFGNLSQAKNGVGAAGSPIRAVLTGGDLQANGSVVNTIEFVNITTTGNAQDFGDLTTASNGHPVSNSTRCVVVANETSSTLIQSFLTATLGNASDFGDLVTATRNVIFCCSDYTRGIFAITNDNTSTNTIEYVSMLTGGGATDFGDLTQECRNGGGCSNAHGGL